ncbi:Lycopene cyclase-type, FAD-binding protein [Corchorus olitorius]|uniref:Lycopene cyclase-type, FAD-binding protein n=1 Tax=Corchorus olitorius TaxID=93759 RepID=A0A1R3JA75_9ROSI|nr:Lycopene cyclase-type, FAD-binding protein [Corchorus olitorius]
MECVGARNFAAMVVSTCATWRSRNRNLMRTKTAISSHHRYISLKVRASGAGSESCVAVKEDFADEEDYIKAGGSELLFVQMQQNKEMDKQSKLADKLPPISIGDNVLDLVVIGCGPAGLALAAESAKLGLNVGLIGPDLPFTNNYGVWQDEFKDLGLERCIEHVWRDTIVYLDDDKPIMIGRAYGRVSRHLLHEELLRRCVESGVMYLSSKVETIIEATDGHSLVVCENNRDVPCRLVTVASGAASGKLLQYEVGGPRVSVQTAYGIEVEVENCPYDPSLMVFMDYRDYAKQQVPCLEAQYPTFLYAMPVTSTRVFFEETCLASKDAMPFDLLKKKLMSRLETLGIRILKVYEEEWSYIPVGGSLPNTEQKNLAFGAAASMVHPATGYSVVRSLSEAPNYASVIAKILKKNHPTGMLIGETNNENISMQAWNTLWPQERKRQRAFFLFGLALIIQLDIEGTRTFFHTFFRLPSCTKRSENVPCQAPTQRSNRGNHDKNISHTIRRLCAAVAPRICNVINLDSRIQTFTTELDELKDKRDDLRTRVERAELDGSRRTNEVQRWLARVEVIESEATSIIENLGQRRHGLGYEVREVRNFEGEGEVEFEVLETLTQLRILGLTISSIASLNRLFGLRNLVRCIHYLLLKECEGLTELVFSSASGLTLRRLSITDCYDFNYLVVNAEDGQKWLPNLEVLSLHGLPKVTSVWKSPVRKASLQNLRLLNIWYCHSLKNVSWVLLLPKLEAIYLFYCKKMEQVVSGEEGLLEPDPKAFSRLKTIEIRDLPELKSISPWTLAFPCLKSIAVIDCPKLKKLPIGTHNSSTLPTVYCSEEWWEGLKWDEPNIRNGFLTNFISN